MKLKQFVLNVTGLIAVVIAGMPSAMAADSSSFSGFYLALGMGQKATTFETSSPLAGGVAAHAGDTSFFGQVSGGYTFATSGDFRVALGAFYDLGDGRAGSATAAGLNVTAKETRRFGVSVEPGLALGKDALAYVKLTYNWGRGELSCVGCGPDFIDSENFSGFGYGIGLKNMISSNTYLYAEWQQIEYGTKTFAGPINISPRSTLGLFGVGMRF